ncbi:MAG: hypothetical protein R3C99_12915 [Pirellulaceae bacterium]
MNRKTLIGLALAACWMASLASSQASAQQNCGFGVGAFSAYGLGFGLGPAAYGLGNVPTPPYFALHPPVYYGERYYRPYGASPFAACSQLNTNPRYRPEPLADFVAVSISNPYCADCASVEPAAAKADEPARLATETAEPQWIENPYCQRVASLGGAR